MKIKIVRLAALLLAAMFLCSCSLISHALGFQGRMWGFIGNDEKVANEKVGEFFEALKAKDAEAMRQLFANNVLDEIDIYAGISELFDYYQGDLVSYKVDPSIGASQSKHDGILSKYIDIMLDIDTTGRTYRVWMYICVTDEGNPDNVGITHVSTCLKKDISAALDHWSDDELMSNGI